MTAETNIAQFPGLSLPLSEIPVQQEVVDRLESLLEDARAGRVLALAYVAVGPHEMIRTSWCGEVSRHLLGYGLSQLQHGYFQASSADE